MQKKALFSAVKTGTQVHYSVLIKEQREWLKGDLKIVKDALRQAKNLNDEVDFHIINL
jgi:phosphoribosyl-AMP cyclohydrolase